MIAAGRVFGWHHVIWHILSRFGFFLFNLGVVSDDLREWIFTLLFVLSLTRNQEIDVERTLSREKQAKKRISNDYRLMIDDGTYEKNKLARYRYQI